MSDRADKVKEVQRLRKRGLKLREIADAMGYSISSVSAWVADPDRSKEIARKNSYRGRCIDCGKSTNGSDGIGMAAERCTECRHERLWGERNRRIVAAWNAGVPSSEIAESEGMKFNTLNSLIQEWRDRGTYDVKRRELPHNNSKERWTQIRELVQECKTNAEIAETIGAASGASVQHMILTMRRQGYEIPRRVRSKNGKLRLG